MVNRYIYPAIFMKDESESVYRVLFSDLNITIDGNFVEEAYLYAKSLLQTYFKYVEKFDFDFELPSKFTDVQKLCGPNDFVMLIDVEIPQEDKKTK